jgi:hypothetical protein
LLQYQYRCGGELLADRSQPEIGIGLHWSRIFQFSLSERVLIDNFPVLNDGNDRARVFSLVRDEYVRDWVEGSRTGRQNHETYRKWKEGFHFPKVRENQNGPHRPFLKPSEKRCLVANKIVVGRATYPAKERFSRFHSSESPDCQC